jgi:hypothetical protein
MLLDCGQKSYQLKYIKTGQLYRWTVGKSHLSHSI